MKLSKKISESLGHKSTTVKVIHKYFEKESVKIKIIYKTIFYIPNF
jgi:hypothetical protein